MIVPVTAVSFVDLELFCLSFELMFINLLVEYEILFSIKLLNLGISVQSVVYVIDGNVRHIIFVIMEISEVYRLSSKHHKY